MSAAHTPGPWAAEPNWMLRAVCITSASGRVATTSSASTVSRDTNIANARLIAAAPELLAALNKLVRAIDRLPGSNSLDGLADEARAAVAKATGEAQS